MAICKYCGQDKKLCEAHIIPKFFYKKMHNNMQNPRLEIMKLGEKRPLISRIGLYDNNILCSDCDNKLGYYDTYAANFFRNIENISSSRQIANDIYVSVISGCDYNYLKLKKFFISLIYRASISQLKEFENVYLGEVYENEARSFLEQTEDNLHFDIIIQKRTSDIYHSIDKIMVLFGRFKLEGINCYELFLDGYRIIIKVDKRCLSKHLEPLSINASNIIMMHQKLEESRDNAFLEALVREKIAKK